MKPRFLSVPAALAALLWAAGVAAQPTDMFYERTPYIGFTPGLNDWAVCSAWEQPATSAFKGLFADWHNQAQLAGVFNTGGAMDANPVVPFWRFVGGSPPGDIYPTGDLCVTKYLSGIIPIIETYRNVNSTHITSEILNQDIPTPPQSSWITLGASGQGNTILASDIANGFIPFGQTPMVTDYLITAETLGGTLHLGAYALTNHWGQPVQPYLVNGVNTNLPPSCQGLTTCNGLDLGTGVPSGNVIVFAENMNVHAITFDVATATFGSLDQTGVYTTPWNLAGHGSTIAGLWIAQNVQFPGAVHDVGISIPHPTQPTTAPGTFTVLRQTLIGNSVYTSLGGGPICHVPFGSLVGGTYYSPAWSVFGPNITRSGPAGWYVVTPGNPSWSIVAVDASGVALPPPPLTPFFFGYTYPAGAQANGSPLSHPTAIGPLQNASLRKGLLWVPYVTASSTYMIDLLEGAAFAGAFPPSLFHTVPQQNHPPLGTTLPKAGRTWPGTVIIPDQKTNYKCEYGLGQHAGLLDY